MTVRRPAAVLWDLDGTLIDGEQWWLTAHCDLATSFGGHLTQQQACALTGVGLDDGVGAVLDACGMVRGPRVMGIGRRRLVRHLVPRYRDTDGWLPGAVAALDAVRAAGIPQALVTNTPRALVDQLLARSNPFDTSVCADEVAAGKPAPDAYLTAADRLGVDIGACVAVEDSPTGVAAAEAAGVPHVMVVPGAVPVPMAPGRTHRATLVGLHVTELTPIPIHH